MIQKRFWSSVDLTGNQTAINLTNSSTMFWSSVDLTGNQTKAISFDIEKGFGAVSI